MSILFRGFWKLPCCSKLNHLDERRHADIILRALADSETQVEHVNRTTYSLTGPSESLLLIPQSKVLQMVLFLCEV